MNFATKDFELESYTYGWKLYDRKENDDGELVRTGSAKYFGTLSHVFNKIIEVKMRESENELTEGKLRIVLDGALDQIKDLGDQLDEKIRTIGEAVMEVGEGGSHLDSKLSQFIQAESLLESG